MFVYGLNQAGDHIHIADVPKGNAAGVTCLYCQGKLTAKKGDILAHHFAHQKDQGETCRGSSTTFQKIVFGFDYYDFALTASQKKALHTLTESCLAQPDGYLIERFIWDQPKSAKYILYKQGISSNRASDRLVNELIEEGFFAKEEQSVQSVPYSPRYSTYPPTTTVMTVIRPSNKALAFCLKLPLFKFIRVLRAWWSELEAELTDPLEKELFLRHQERMNRYRLYVLTIKAGWQQDPAKGYPVLTSWRNPQNPAFVEADQRIAAGNQPIYKVGITGRPIAERMTEIRQFLVKNWCPVPTIELVHDLDGGAALAEMYFKKKYKISQFPIHTATEYFALDQEQLRLLKPDFHQLILKTSAHAEKIKAGMASMTEKSARGKEKMDSFLAKPDIQNLLPLLGKGYSLRELNRMTNVAINTIRKAIELTRPTITNTESNQ